MVIPRFGVKASRLLCSCVRMLMIVSKMEFISQCSCRDQLNRLRCPSQFLIVHVNHMQSHRTRSGNAKSRLRPLVPWCSSLMGWGKGLCLRGLTASSFRVWFRFEQGIMRYLAHRNISLQYICYDLRMLVLLQPCKNTSIYQELTSGLAIVSLHLYYNVVFKISHSHLQPPNKLLAVSTWMTVSFLKNRVLLTISTDSEQTAT